MPSTDSAVTLLPADLIAAIETETRSHVVSIVPRAGGGASRQGAELRLRGPDGHQKAAYLSYDSRTADPNRLAFFAREAAILRGLSGPFAASGVRAPLLLATDPHHLALLTALVPGSDRYHDIEDAGVRVAVAQDLIAQLATLHRLDPRSLPTTAFGDAERPVSQIIADRIKALRAENLATAPDPILLLALDWLEANIPADRGPAVIVHGDAGPGNFLHEHGRVTALLDWELCHFGDPMEDLAQIWVRSLFQPFMPPRAMFAAYEAEAGVAVDIDQVRYHRLYFQIGFTVSSHATLFGNNAVRPAALGTTLLFYTAHMRVIVQSLAELAGLPLPPVALSQAEPSWRDRIFVFALDDIHSVIAPRATDQLAATKAKSLARLVKFWRARDQYGAAYDAAEVAEVSAALNRPFGAVQEARAGLAHAVIARTISFGDALRLCNARVTRETALMADAMGSFKDTYFPPFE